DEDARLAELRAAMRPWAIVDADAATLEADYGRAVKLLAAWAEQETWNWRENQNLVGQNIAPPQAGVSKYLTAPIGLAPAVAKVRAEEIIRGLVVSWLHVPRSERTDGKQPQLRAAIFARRERSLEEALRAARSLSAADYKTLLSETLADAVEWPFGLERL